MDDSATGTATFEVILTGSIRLLSKACLKCNVIAGVIVVFPLEKAVACAKTTQPREFF